ncbi:WYL domain-containing protein [Pseudoalteromonas sp. JBTF-M23]|uniref:WYL domain-containing protein n=1 Tax=Pseudoalteromonas caenipelagi TaxID=2726988 RepID=A0A849VC64_9GAMM|nr:WYL domain-containing protein [Pseudoalteromonas caenipelagi]NOU51249.1 WYL domain-containing protein [Pseudoalteromonas caenipelagi]
MMREKPRCIYFNYPVWYMFAWDHLRAGFRTFRIDRIVDACLVEQPFKVKAFEAFSHLIETDTPITL